jgi:AcrR family transcriptional regulator
LDAAIADAVVTVLLTDGYSAITMDRVAAVAGTTRTALYRRFAGRVALALGVLVARFGTDPAPDTGNLRSDLTELQRRQAVFFRDPIVEAAITGVLADSRADPTLTASIHDHFMAPRRRSTAAMLQRAVERGEIPPVADPALISDLLTGPLLLRAVLPATGPIDDTLIEATVESALHALRFAPQQR